MDIHKRGFPVVPNFSTTLDAATGQTLQSSMCDLGDEFNKPLQSAAMRGYIALSRAKAANDVLVAQPLN
eukprot:2193225-Karenia_brevis.AAC.1